MIGAIVDIKDFIMSENHRRPVQQNVPSATVLNLEILIA